MSRTTPKSFLWNLTPKTPLSDLGLPYGAPDTPQVAGRKAEAKQARKRGARQHPNSGAGSIKWDASSTDKLFEIKTVQKSHTLKGAYLLQLFRDAIRQGKEPYYIVTFTDEGLEVECRIRKI